MLYTSFKGVCREGFTCFWRPATPSHLLILCEFSFLIKPADTVVRCLLLDFATMSRSRSRSPTPRDDMKIEDFEKWIERLKTIQSMGLMETVHKGNRFRDLERRIDKMEKHLQLISTHLSNPKAGELPTVIDNCCNELERLHWRLRLCRADTSWDSQMIENHQKEIERIKKHISKIDCKLDTWLPLLVNLITQMKNNEVDGRFGGGCPLTPPDHRNVQPVEEEREPEAEGANENTDVQHTGRIFH